MKHRKKSLFALLAAGMIAAGAVPQLPAQAANVVVLSPSDKYAINNGIFEGWGTSLCWWANRVGYSDSLAQQAADAFYGENGLRLNIARFNIGGGDDPTHNHITRTDSAMPGYTKYQNGTVTYDWTADANQRNVLKRCVEAAGDDAIVEMFSNSPPYWMCKSGCTSGNIADHLVKINAEYYTPTDKYFIPTGEIASVYGTVLDFTDFRRIGDGFDKEYKELEYQGGYDHNFILKDPFTLREIATVKDPASGRVMRVYSDMPAVQFYTGNMIDGLEKGKDGKAIKYRSGFCIEPQFSPDSPNLDDRFPSCVLKANERYAHTNIYKFETE